MKNQINQFLKAATQQATQTSITEVKMSMNQATALKLIQEQEWRSGLKSPNILFQLVAATFQLI